MTEQTSEATATRSPSEGSGAERYLKGLREYADWIEANPDVLAPYQYDQNLCTVVVYRRDLDELAATVRILGGHREKNIDEKWFNVERRFGPVTVQVYTSRDEVCERIVTGTRAVTETIRDPELLEQVPLVTVEREEEIVEWRCPDVILAEVQS